MIEQIIKQIIKQSAQKVKLYFDEDKFTFFIKLNFFNKELHKHLCFGSFLGEFSSQWSFKGFEVNYSEFTTVKEKIVSSYLESSHINSFLDNLVLQEEQLKEIKYRPNKTFYFDKSIQDYVEQSDEDYHEDNWIYDSKTDSRKLFDMSLPTLSEYIKSEEFLLNYAERFLQETLLTE